MTLVSKTHHHCRWVSSASEHLICHRKSRLVSPNINCKTKFHVWKPTQWDWSLAKYRWLSSL